MHAVFLVCLVGGLVSTALLAVLGALTGAIGHGAGHIGGHEAGHLHVDTGQVHTAHLPAAHTHGIAHAGSAHAQPAATHGSVAHPGGHQQTGGHALHQSSGTGSGHPLTTALGWTLSWFTPLTLAAGVLWFGGGGLLAGLAAPALAVPVAIVAAILGAALVRALMAAFVRADAAPLSAGAEGALGELTAPIRPDGPGEVLYTLEGLHRSAAARSLDGTPLPRGTRVVIVRRERGIAYVTPMDPLERLWPAAASVETTDITADTMPAETQ
jgi:membrane protein implicated in regulation of membrane protease activity